VLDMLVPIVQAIYVLFHVWSVIWLDSPEAGIAFLTAIVGTAAYFSLRHIDKCNVVVRCCRACVWMFFVDVALLLALILLGVAIDKGWWLL